VCPAFGVLEGHLSIFGRPLPEGWSRSLLEAVDTFGRLRISDAALEHVRLVDHHVEYPVK
jgi:hypothetical protein